MDMDALQGSVYNLLGRSNRVRLIILVAILWAVASERADAYVDPTFGGIAFQAAYLALASVAVSVTMFPRRVMAALSWVRNKIWQKAPTDTQP